MGSESSELVTLHPVLDEFQTVPRNKNGVKRSDGQKDKVAQSAKVDPGQVPLIDQTFPLEIYWTNVVLCVALHAAGAYGLYQLLSGQVMWQTILFQIPLFIFTGLGVSAGCHRLWSHRSYKARLPLRILLVTMQTYGFQYSVYDWARTHRVHHKYTETNADPHNIKRGFWFAHVGWLLVKEHPAVTQKLQELDTRDLEADAVVMFQKKYYWQLVVLAATSLPVLYTCAWGEKLEVGIFFGTLASYTYSLNITGFINSAAHMWGNRPYDKNFGPTDNVVMAYVAGGEGYHNYHHAFPWDYKTDEWGRYGENITTIFMDFLAWIGWAYDLKTVRSEVVLARVSRTGDGSHPSCHGGHGHGQGQGHSHNGTGTWGWGDKAISKAELDDTLTLHPARFEHKYAWCT